MYQPRPLLSVWFLIIRSNSYSLILHTWMGTGSTLKTCSASISMITFTGACLLATFLWTGSMAPSPNWSLLWRPSWSPTPWRTRRSSLLVMQRSSTGSSMWGWSPLLSLHWKLFAYGKERSEHWTGRVSCLWESKVLNWRNVWVMVWYSAWWLSM